MSWSPTADPQPHEMLVESEATATSPAEIKAVTNTGQESLRLRKLANDNPQYQMLKHYIMHRFPEHRCQLTTTCRCYWNIHTQLSIEDHLIFFGFHLLIPMEIRRDVLTQLHRAHQGMTHTKQRARLVVYLARVGKLHRECHSILQNLPRCPTL